VNSALVTKAARRSLGQIRHVSPVPPRKAEGLVARVYAQTERDFGMLAPPVALHSPAPAVLAGAWVMLRETLLAAGTAGRAEKEVVAAATSAANSCPYCVSVHGAAIRGLARGAIPDQIAAGHAEEITDGRLREVACFARQSSQRFPQKSTPVGYIPELAAVAVTFHYLNRMVNVFLPDSLLPASAPSALGGAFLRVLGSVMLSPDAAPGASLSLLPAAPLPADLAWSAGEPRVAAALARAAAAMEEAGARAVPEHVREVVIEQLRNWDGRPPGPSPAWAGTLAAGLPPADRPAARLALLTALASYQVGPADVDDLRCRGDEMLIGLTSWASMAAARRIGSWLRQPWPEGGTPRDARPDGTWQLT